MSVDVSVPVAAVHMTAVDVLGSLRMRWPESEHLLIQEAPQQSDRTGRKLDLLVVALWRSRGLQRDGVEIKVSYSDWKRELNEAAKADWWWSHVHRFWLAAPAALAERIALELPPGWGLLACEQDKAPKVIVKPGQREPEDFSWAQCVGLMRASASAGLSALDRAHRDGWAKGEEAGRRQGADGHWQRQYERIADRVAEFEKTSGVSLDHWNIGDVGKLVALVRDEKASPGSLAQTLGWSAEALSRDAQDLARAAARAHALAKAVADHIAGITALPAAPSDTDEP